MTACEFYYKISACLSDKRKHSSSPHYKSHSLNETAATSAEGTGVFNIFKNPLQYASFSCLIVMKFTETPENAGTKYFGI